MTIIPNTQAGKAGEVWVRIADYLSWEEGSWRAGTANEYQLNLAPALFVDRRAVEASFLLCVSGNRLRYHSPKRSTFVR